MTIILHPYINLVSEDKSYEILVLLRTLSRGGANLDGGQYGRASDGQ